MPLLALDFDETLAPTYQYVIPVWESFMAQWLVRHGHYPNETAARTEMGKHAFNNPYGCGPTFLAKQFGRNTAWIDAFYQAVVPFAVTACIKGGMSSNPQLNHKLLELKDKGYIPVIISQAHRDYILPLLPVLGLESIIPPTMVVDRAHKRVSSHGYEVAQHLTNHLNLETFYMADDSAENFPHATNCGFICAHIHPEAKSRQVATASYHYKTLIEFLNVLP
jgi:hypothetical protein